MCDQRRFRSSAQSDQSSLIAYAFYSLQAIQRAINDNPCHTGRMYRLVWAFAGHTGVIVAFVVCGLKYHCILLNNISLSKVMVYKNTFYVGVHTLYYANSIGFRSACTSALSVFGHSHRFIIQHSFAVILLKKAMNALVRIVYAQNGQAFIIRICH